MVRMGPLTRRGDKFKYESELFSEAIAAPALLPPAVIIESTDSAVDKKLSPRMTGVGPI